MDLEDLAKLAGVQFTECKSGGIGKNESRILDQYEQRVGYRIERQKCVAGFKLDGYDPVKNRPIEVDEIHHKYKRIEDSIREGKVNAVLQGNGFIRIKDGW